MSVHKKKQTYIDKIPEDSVIWFLLRIAYNKKSEYCSRVEFKMICDTFQTTPRLKFPAQN